MMEYLLLRTGLRRVSSPLFRGVRSFSSTSILATRTTTFGLLRETYNPWERRAPLTPHHVTELLEHQPHVKVMVQPSSQRVFSDQDYRAAGAHVVEDVSPADILLGVKRPLNVTDLLPHKTYLFFSHTIKGQAANMGLLQYCLDQKIQLMDYERMMEPHDESFDPSHPPKQRRLVSFGRFAGLAGAIDTLGALGRRLLYTRQLSTPLLNIPPAWMHASLQHAQETVTQLFSEQAEHGPVRLTSSESNAPLVIAVTGQGGSVHAGAMEILKLLPHSLVSVQDLPQATELKERSQDNHAQSSPVLLCPVSVADVFERTDGQPFDRHDFGDHPEQYRSLFAHRVAPYCHAIVHCAYWDDRYPRLLTKSQLKRLFEQQQQNGGHPRLLLISDLSCDVHGSMECLEHTTTMEQPFFQYDPISQRVTADCINDDAHSVTVMGVDILPAELPRESSEFFGQQVKHVLRELALIRTHQQSERGVDVELMSPHLASAVITTKDGELTNSYRYLETLMTQAPVLDHPSMSMVLLMEGHLFDSGLINHVLDVIEQHGGGVHFDECIFPRGCGASVSSEPVKSRVALRVTANDLDTLTSMEAKIQALVTAIQKADASIKRLDKNGYRLVGTATVESPKQLKRVLLLGAGRVATSFVEYLSRSGDVRVVVAGDKEEEVRVVAGKASNGQHVILNASTDQRMLSDLIEDADLVCSLLPAPMHPLIARECIFHRKHLVTASYESGEMRELNQRAIDANVIILNEVGLDPGLDHMSAMKIIDDIKSRGGTVTRFYSVCGGLPAPEASNNPLRYKFSWSPLGVIRACQNSALYRLDGKIVRVPGRDLLRTAEPFHEAWPELQLECLPNRDSIRYESVYGIETAATIFRGTLRYSGFSSLLNVFKNMGLLEPSSIEEKKWPDIIDMLRRQSGGFESLQAFLDVCSNGDTDTSRNAMQTLEWLGVLDARNCPSINQSTMLDAFCSVLEDHLKYEPGERDMVAMHHRIDATLDDGEIEEHHYSQLQVFGCSKGSAMAKTVGYPAAASAELILEGALKEERGLLLPIVPKVYGPVLEKMKDIGITFSEGVSYRYPTKNHVEKA